MATLRIRNVLYIINVEIQILIGIAQKVELRIQPMIRMMQDTYIIKESRPQSGSGNVINVENLGQNTKSYKVN
jgi:hypothetical protein